MARRVSWTNNSSGHLGTYVYRAPTLDPQNLPAPVATVGPVAQGETAEWIDNDALSAGDYDYAVQDFDGEAVGTLSAVDTFTVPEDLAAAQAGDYVGGGVYAGINTESDGSEYHIIFAKQDGELVSGAAWKTSKTATSGTSSTTDGWANTQAMIAAGITQHEAADYCINYTDAEGNNDYYLPAQNELALEANLRDHAEMSTDRAAYRWASNQLDSFNARVIRFTDGAQGSNPKDWNTRRVRPVRRVPV